MGINDILKHFGDYVYRAVSLIEINDTLSVDTLSRKDEHLLVLNKKNTAYYCLELSGAGTTEEFLNAARIDQIFDNFKSKEDAKIINVLIKKGRYQKNLLFSPNRNLIDFIAKSIGGRLVNDIDAIVYLYDIFLQNNYFIKNKKLTSSFDRGALDYSRLSRSFNWVVKDAVYKDYEQLKAFQGFRVSKRIDASVGLSKMFMLDFEGVLFNTIDFSKDKVQHLLSQRKKDAFIDGASEPFKEILKAYEQNNVKLALLNSFLVLKKGDIVDAMGIGACFGIDFVEKHLDKHKYIKNTPLLLRDNYFDMFVDDGFLNSFVGICHKQNLDKKEASFYGIDIHGAHMNYDFSNTTDIHANKSSDFAIIGVKGSGKTTAFNGLLAQVLNYNPTNDPIKTKTLGDFKQSVQQNKIRYFDIKKSGKLLIDMIHKDMPHKVDYIETSLNTFRFNPVNIKNWRDRDGNICIDRDELALNVLLISIIIESKGQNTSGTSNSEGLTAMEKTILSKAVIDIYEKELYEYEYIENFKESHPLDYQTLIDLGYQPNQTLEEVTQKKFDHLKVPKLNTLMKHIKGLSKDNQNETLKKAAESLTAQLTLVDSMQIFSDYDKFNYNDVNILHIDFDPIKDLSEYIPIFLSLFLKMYRNDKLSQDKLSFEGNRATRPWITYIFEEAKNVTEQPSFKEFFAKVSNEARSYRIKLGFVTQFVSHIPPHILKQISNKFFLFPSKNQRNALIQEVDDAIGINEKTKSLMEKTPEFGIVLVNEHDSTSFKLDMSPDEIALFGQEQ